MHRLLKIEWDAVAGVLAAVTAIVLHFLHVIQGVGLWRRRQGRKAGVIRPPQRMSRSYWPTRSPAAPPSACSASGASPSCPDGRLALMLFDASLRDAS